MQWGEMKIVCLISVYLLINTLFSGKMIEAIDVSAFVLWENKFRRAVRYRAGNVGQSIRAVTEI